MSELFLYYRRCNIDGDELIDLAASVAGKLMGEESGKKLARAAYIAAGIVLGIFLLIKGISKPFPEAWANYCCIILGAGSDSGSSSCCNSCNNRPYEEKVKEQTVDAFEAAFGRAVNVPVYSNTEGLRG